MVAATTRSAPRACRCASEGNASRAAGGLPARQNPKRPKGDPLEQIVKLEREMNQVQEKYKVAEESYGSDTPQPRRRQGLSR